MKSIGEIFYLPFLALIVKLRTWIEERYVRTRLYLNPSFKQSDLALKEAYAKRDPFQISKEFLTQKGHKDIYAYGETPLTVFEEIGKRCQVSVSDHFIDLGCGRGRGVFFFAQRYGCSAVGIDWIEEFTNSGNQIAKDLSNVGFSCQHILEADLSKATIIYLYGTSLEDQVILKLIEKFKQLAPGTKIVSVSFPIAIYCDPLSFPVKESFRASFPWGKADVYIQTR